MKRLNGVVLDGVLVRWQEAPSLVDKTGEDCLLGLLISDGSMGAAGGHAVLFQARLAAEVRAFAAAAAAAAAGDGAARTTAAAASEAARPAAATGANAAARTTAAAAAAGRPAAVLEVTVWGYLWGNKAVVADRVSFHVSESVRSAASRAVRAALGVSIS